MELISVSEDVRDLSESAEDDRFSFHKKLLDSLFDRVYFVDSERKITYWNQGADRLMYFSKSAGRNQTAIG
jgi:PAS domain-containing protein